MKYFFINSIYTRFLDFLLKNACPKMNKGAVNNNTDDNN